MWIIHTVCGFQTSAFALPLIGRHLEAAHCMFKLRFQLYGEMADWGSILYQTAESTPWVAEWAPFLTGADKTLRSNSTFAVQSMATFAALRLAKTKCRAIGQ